MPRRLRGRGLDFEEARPYVIGDDIRNIDWNVTAKTGKTHTKVFTEEKGETCYLFSLTNRLPWALARTVQNQSC